MSSREGALYTETQIANICTQNKHGKGLLRADDLSLSMVIFML